MKYWKSHAFSSRLNGWSQGDTKFSCSLIVGQAARSYLGSTFKLDLMGRHVEARQSNFPE